jgi:hypothetical protein
MHRNQWSIGLFPNCLTSSLGLIQNVGTTAYHLELPPDNHIHLVFHVSQLKQYTPNFTPVFSKLPVMNDFSQEHLIPKVILETTSEER